jgi:hypothetical protein
MKKSDFIKQASLAKQLMFVAIMALTFQSCIKDNFDTKKIAEIKYNPKFAVPLVYSSLSMSDILNLKNANDSLQTGSDGSLTLIYTDNIISQDASSISAFNIPNQSQVVTISTTTISGVISNGNSVTTSHTQTITVTSSSQLSSVILKGGTLDLSFSSGIKSNVDIVISIPGATKSGVAFSQTVTLNYTGTTPVTASPSFDLTGYDFDLSQGGTTYNQFDVNYTVKVYGPATITGTEQFSIGVAMDSLAYSKIVGNIGQHIITGKTDTIAVTIFNHSIGAASFQFLNPKVKLIAYNSFGVPIDAQLTQLSGDNLTGTSNILQSSSTPFPIAIASPNLSQAGQTLMASDSLTTTNSNIVSVFNQTPKNIIYTLSAQTTTVSASQTDFVLDTSKFRLNLEVELPLNGTNFKFAMVDTEAFSISSTITDNLSSGLLRISNTNGFPIDVNMQVYFVDSLFNKLDSLLTSEQPLIASGIINSAGVVTTPTITNTDITIDSARLKKLVSTKQVLIYAKVNTVNSGATPVKIYSNYTLEVKLGLQIQVNAHFKP